MKKEVICFDFDDVITNRSSFIRIASLVGKTTKKVKIGLRLLEDNENPKEFYKAIKDGVSLGKGVKYSNVQRIAYFIRLTKNAKKTLKKLKENGHKIVIISTNDVKLIKKFIKRKKIDKYIDHIYASRLGVRNGRLTGKIYGDVIKTEKLGALREIKNRYGKDPKDIVYVADGLTDLPIMKRVGKGILFCPNPIANAEVLVDRQLMQMKREGRLFLVEDKDLSKILEFVS
ncbi:MAG: HAD-IB family phosphatase [Candidatus Aenigmarchaeota archaeon]|nr:HAD-IB family phosphatase [Candidatus Aenigmarchaeota archaeon]